MKYLRAMRLFFSLVWRHWENPKDFAGIDPKYLITYRLTIADAWEIAKSVHIKL